ncbi:hypothetical protein PVAND_008485 [Polypedilum vanderplanki]|uniref:F-box domain-containing protein n=1 Tax=Polypedilum vanderplanki TaxID=319348 RepID=A0A9J6C9N8_POLVA|nr:hypothetical protein PVAND_008485 [Polypedilum vanderplanki]
METLELKECIETDFIDKVVEVVSKPFKKKSMDIVNLLPPKIVNHIFSYCKPTDLLTMSLINRKWYRFIGKSPSCMDRIKIVISEPRIGCFQLLTNLDAIILTQHGRNYKHIQLTSLERQFLFQHKLLLATFQWETVSLNNHTFRNKIDFVNFLGMIEPFVETLTLRGVKIAKTNYQISPTNFQFPLLEKLNLINCSTYVYSEPFKYVTTLKCLNIQTDAFPTHQAHVGDELTERVKALQTILLNNVYIYYLELFIHQKDFDAMFMDQRFLNRIRFNLQWLSVGKFKQKDNEDINVVQINNFVDFLKSQMHSLSILYLDNWLGNATLEYAINDMQLTNFTIANIEPLGMHDESIANLNLFSNDTIENLTLWSSSRHQAVAEEIVKVCRVLRVLETRTINQSMLEALIENNEDIQIIICDFFSAYLPPHREVMRNLRMMKINIACDSDVFRDIIGIKNFYTNFEMIFLRAAKDLRRRCALNGVNFFRY